MAFWAAAIPAIASIAGSWLSNKDAAKSPSAPPPIDLEELTRLMMVNTQSPWGGMTYTKDPITGQYTGKYEFSEAIEPVFDRMTQRAVTPDQAQQMAPELQQLQQALMQQRLQGTQQRPMPERRPANVGPPPGFPSDYRPYGG